MALRQGRLRQRNSHIHLFGVPEKSWGEGYMQKVNGWEFSRTGYSQHKRWNKSQARPIKWSTHLHLLPWKYRAPEKRIHLKSKEKGEITY